ncbi:MAG: protein kinase [Oscillospiraceae bacterium]|nr:protein kinase [Oscillospiraceae bacterium]
MGKSFAGEILKTDDLATFPPDITGRFNVLELLAQNDFGETFLLSEKNGGKRFIIKSLRQSELSPESETLRGLEHKGLPRFEPQIEGDGAVFSLREYIDGLSLEEYLLEHPVADEMLAVHIIAELCDILTLLHSQPTPIIHRDIKPSNIIIDPNNHSVMLIDFGVSRKLCEESGSDTVLVATRGYAAPEQFGFAQTDTRSDIYSLGVVLRNMLTGSENRISSKALERITQKCTALDPKARFQSAVDLKKALIKAKPRKSQKVMRRLAVALTVCALFAIGFAAAQNMGFSKPEVLPKPADYMPPESNAVSEPYTTPEILLAVAESTPPGIIEDWNFYNAVLEIIGKSDGYEIIEDDVAEITYLDISRRDIKSLTGIEFFTVLEYLFCSDSELTSLDVSNNSLLKDLNCSNNQITLLNVNGLTNLEYIYCDRNQLTELDVSGLTTLEQLHCWENQLTTLDVSSNTELKEIYCSDNQLTELDVSGLVNLKYLACQDNRLTSLDVSSLSALKELYCYINELTELDVSNNKRLAILHCERNRLTSLNVSGLTALEELHFANNNLKTLDVSSNTALKALACNENQLNSLNVSGLIALEWLGCPDNNLKTLDFSGNIALKLLDCSSNNINSLDVSGLTALESFACCRNNLKTLDISNNTALVYLECQENQLTSLDISNNPALKFLYCFWNYMGDDPDISIPGWQDKWDVAGWRDNTEYEWWFNYDEERIWYFPH